MARAATRLTTQFIMTRQQLSTLRPIRAGCAFILATALGSVALAQTAPAPPPNLAKQAIENRKAVFTLIGNNFKPIGEILRGNATYESAEVGKYVTRVSFLTGFLVEAFPEVSKSGDTQAKSEIWANRADFDKRAKDFSDHASALSQVVAQGGGNSDAFKTAARAVAQDCKGCHDNYRNK
jgi:cytochrome c556